MENPLSFDPFFIHYEKVPGRPGPHSCLFSLPCQSLCRQPWFGLDAGDSGMPEWQGGCGHIQFVCQPLYETMLLLRVFSKHNRFLKFQVTGKFSTFLFKSVLGRLKQNENYKTNHFALKNYTQVFIYCLFCNLQFI